LVTDLSHFLGLPVDTPGPACRLAEHLGNIVRATTAGEAEAAWEPGVPVWWQCSVCDGEGVISNWEDSPFGLRRRGLTLAGAVNEIVTADEAAAVLRGLRLLDTGCE
jgi:hypothetical protein